MLSSQNNPLAVSGKCSLSSAVLRDVSLIHVSCVQIPWFLLEAPVLELPYTEIALNTPEDYPTAAGILTCLSVNPGRSFFFFVSKANLFHGVLIIIALMEL